MKETSVDLDNDFQILHFLKQANSSDFSWKIFSSADIHRRLIIQVASQNKNLFFFFFFFGGVSNKKTNKSLSSISE